MLPVCVGQGRCSKKKRSISALASGPLPSV
jgi:hypothetical protein